MADQPTTCPSCNDTTDSVQGAHPSDYLEALAALEHRQWMHWTRHVAATHDIPATHREKWEANWMPYSALDDDTKEMDRRWAREALAIITEDEWD